jgi:hypothetical protein
MKRLTVLLVAVAVVTSGAAYGSTFFHDFVGVWRAKGKHINSTLSVQKQKNGGLFLRMTGKFINKGWLNPNGRYKGETFSQGRKVEASLGTWRLNGTNVLEVFVKSHDGLGKSIIRRMNRDRFVYKETGNSAVTLTRIRK